MTQALDTLLEQAIEKIGQGDFVAATQLCHQAEALDERYYRTYHVLGILAQQSNQPLQAIHFYRKSLSRNPEAYGSNYNLGYLLFSQNEFADAEPYLQKACELDPTGVDGFFMLSMNQEGHGDISAAIASMRQACLLMPAEFGIADRYLDLLLKNKEEHQEQVPENAFPILSTWRNQEKALSLLGMTADAYANSFQHEKAYQYLRTMDQSQIASPLTLASQAFLLNTLPFLTAEETFAFGQHVGAFYDQSQTVQNRCELEKKTKTKLNIGYISGHFRASVITVFIDHLIKQHNTERFQLFFYSLTTDGDDVTTSYARHPGWRDLTELTPQQQYDQIQADDIDILIDLSGQTTYNGLTAFQVMSAHPARIQATWLGYLATSGLKQMDYRITDAFADPIGKTEAFHTERLIRLPHTQWCYCAIPEAQVSVKDPDSPHIIFACFNNFAKVNRELLRIWLRILHACPNSQLLLITENTTARELVLEQAHQANIAPERIQFHARLSLRQYFELYNQVHICLDSFPYGGGTTTMDTLWMGRPVITYSGSYRAFSRSTGSILNELKLTECISYSWDEYIAKAVALAHNPTQLQTWRQQLRAQMEQSSLMDISRFSKDLEHVYEQMWQEYLVADTSIAEQHEQENQTTARSLLAEAKKEMKAENLTTAIDLFTKAYGLQPDEEELAQEYLWCGYRLAEAGRENEVPDAIWAALKRHPDSELALQLRGRLAVKKANTYQHDVAYRYIQEHFRSNVMSPETVGINSFLYNTFPFCQPDQVFEFSKYLANFYERFSSIQVGSALPSKESNAPQLKIGYIGGDFKGHVVSLFLASILKHHDASRYQIFLYSLTPKEDQDHVTTEYQQYEGWRDLSTLPIQAQYETILQDQIDLLIDLSGYTHNNGLAIMVAHPARMQATWLGYLATTGLSAMDYRICDHFSDPIGQTEDFHTEKLVRLPHTQWCYQPTVESQIPVMTKTNPASLNSLIFGSFNNFIKVNRFVMSAWFRILNACPNSRLMILSIPQDAQYQVIEHAHECGIDPERFMFYPNVPLPDYFGLYNQVDICLDSYPYGGGTTTFDALWMGRPVITYSGSNRAFSRSAGSILNELKLTDCISYSWDEYVEKAITLANNPARLKELHQTLRSQLQNSAMMDPALFTKDLEHVFEQMWREYLNQNE